MAELAPAAAAAPAPAAAKATKKKPAARPKKVGPSVTELIVQAVTASKERNGLSVPALKKYLGANGYDVEKNNSRVNFTIRGLVKKGTLVQTKGAGASGSFKISKDAQAKKPAVKKPAAKKAAAPKAKKPAAKKAVVAKKATPKKAKKPAAKKPVAAKKATPKKAKKPVAAKKAAAKPRQESRQEPQEGQARGQEITRKEGGKAQSSEEGPQEEVDTPPPSTKALLRANHNSLRAHFLYNVCLRCPTIC